MKSIKKSIIGYFGKRMSFNIFVFDSGKTIQQILKKNCSIIRFGDGEFDLIRGESIPYQDYDSKLAQRMKKLILKGSDSRVLIGLPDVFKNMDRYTNQAQSFYYSNFFVQNRKILREIEKSKHKYNSTFISRPYIDLKNKKDSSYIFKELRQIWSNKDILIVEGIYSRSGEGNDLFNNARSIKRILCPPKNAYFKREEIEKTIRKYSGNRLVLLMLGPTSKIIIDDLKDLKNQFIDLGHIDSEYEWFKMGVTEKVKLSNKHTAEFNYDDEKIILNRDKNFDSQVLEIIG